jgi:hypothetical protein
MRKKRKKTFQAETTTTRRRRNFPFVISAINILFAIKGKRSPFHCFISISAMALNDKIIIIVCVCVGKLAVEFEVFTMQSKERKK